LKTVTTRWIVPAVALLTGIGAVAVLILHGHKPSADQRLFAALRSEGVSLTGRIREMPPAARRRGREGVPLHVAAAAASVLDANGGSSDPSSRRAAGVAHLILGNVEAAITDLSQVTSSGGTAAAWNDLAAALLERASRERNAEDLIDALGAADRALRIDPTVVEAEFNRALALQSLHLNAAASDAWQRYLIMDATSQWASEARERTAALVRPTRVAEWRRAMTRLAAAAADGDSATVNETVAAFPEQARNWAETEFLNEWAVALIRNDDAAAAEQLRLARSIGAALLSQTGEALLHDAVARIDTAGASRRMLASAHHDYREARLLYSRRRVAEAAPLFVAAERNFGGAGSQMVLLAAYNRANVLYDEKRSDEALALLRETLSKTPARYMAARAQMLWTEASILLNQGRPFAALAIYGEAKKLFETLREPENVSTMRDNEAITLSLLGRTGDAWALRARGFEDASSSGDPSRIQYALEAAARQALRQQKWNAAQSILSVALAIGQQSPRQRAASLVWRAFAAWRTGETTVADLHAAREAVSAIPDATLRQGEAIQLDLAEAIIERQRDPRAAARMLTGVVTFATQKQQTTILPSTLYERALALRNMGDLAAATRDLDQAAAIIEGRRAEVTESDLRDTLLDTASGIYSQLIDVRLAEGDTDGAFLASERMRSRRILEETCVANALPVRALEVVTKLPRGTALVSYVGSGDRIIAFVATASGLRAVTLYARKGQIHAWSAQLVAAMEARRADAVRRSSAALYQALIEPVEAEVTAADTLIVVPDDTTEGVPFAALVDRASHFLIERLAIVIAPSASMYLRCSAFEPRPLTAATVVGAPIVDRTRYPSLVDLLAAEGEARDIAAVYRTKALTGEKATAASLVRELSRCDVAHIATHAIAERSNSALSLLVLTPERDDGGALYVRDIARLRLPRHPVVVLSACRTAAVTRAADSIRSIALAFLVAGSRSVVGTLWDVDDATAPQIAIDLHRGLAGGMTAAAALRDAQIAAIHRDGGAFADVKSWSAFQVYGTGL
jgi:CHAT domain-containing protein